MNKILYFHVSPYVIVWYKIGKNLPKNLGVSVNIENCKTWEWTSDTAQSGLIPVGASCLAQW